MSGQIRKRQGILAARQVTMHPSDDSSSSAESTESNDRVIEAVKRITSVPDGELNN